jgi:hypothetical protein
VAVVIRICIKDDEMMLAPEKYEIVFVPVLSRLVTEYAPCRLPAQNIVDPPGRP